ncbi:MmpS family transport accessory protein [Mycobacterium sp. 1274756.6]|uniref:MmpS family transport accessory protein n=1 Tax=Mycobacterium sp. 1274756.6 TaxID=1834076 RepID=UPI0007FF74F0|nr:MmpS family transport accessory protein [Mycobacterium sp. 1274756.6]OBJ70397.1 hypothetical protein A5643_10350 [Mycobacterium sp. 1274756.6]
MTNPEHGGPGPGQQPPVWPGAADDAQTQEIAVPQTQFVPERRSKKPWLIGAAVAVVVVLVIAAAAALANRSWDGKDRATAAPGEDTTSVVPVNEVTYEITGDLDAPLAVLYTDFDGLQFNDTVAQLPWSITLAPEPRFLSFLARPLDLNDEEPVDITLRIKRGNTVLKTCAGIGVCDYATT